MIVIKKRIISLILICAFALNLSSCGNRATFDTEYTFDAAIITFGDRTYKVKIKSWRDYEDGEQLQLKLEDDSILLVSSYNTILVHWNSDGDCSLYKTLI